MDFQPDPVLEAFRIEVRDFLTRALPPELAHLPRAASASARPPTAAWQAILHRQGWGAPGWAEADGGTGWSVAQQMIFDDECMRAGAPTLDIFGQKLLGPVVNQFGTPAQKAEHIPLILSGERIWCQGFSEPGSGSDLASLRTRAERRGDNYILNGQKTWSSSAHDSDWMFVLARTDPEARRQAGISFFLVDMKTPGIVVRPIVSIDDCHHLNETFFDDVAVPAANLLGAEGQGWAITKFLLNNEHASTADLPQLRAYMRRILALAGVERPGGAPIERPQIVATIVRLEAELAAVEIMVERSAAMHGEQGHFAHALGSMLKLRGTELQQRMSSFLLELLGDYGAVAYPPPGEGPALLSGLPGEDFATGVATDMFFRRASTIYGGTSEIQRGIIAKLMFGF